MPVTSRSQLTDYILRKLGHPVVQINVDDDQVEDRIDDALQFFQDYHYDATQKVFISHKMTATDVAMRYIDMAQISGQANTIAGSNVVVGYSTAFASELTEGVTAIKIGTETKLVSTIINNQLLYVDSVYTNAYDAVPVTNITESDSIIGVSKILPVSSSATVNMFDLRYQLRLHDLYDFTSSSYVNFVLTQQHLRTLEMLFVGENPIRFNRKQNRLYVDMDWGRVFQVGEFVLIEAYKIVNPEGYTAIYDDRFLKRYATALVKRQWGANLSKFTGIKLPGDVMFNGQEIFNQAQVEIDQLEDDIQLFYEAPAAFEIG